jgi:hypothetical protein
VIYDKNAFDAKRGVIDEEDGEAIEEDVVVKGSYTFELRGILGAGPKQVALFSAKPNSRSSSSKGRTVSRSTTTSSSNKIHICRIGASIAESDFKLTSIENGEVKIEDSKGNEQTFDFSLTSDESLQRSEVSFKNEASRQKSFAKQNTFKQPVKSQAPKTPTKITPEQAAKKRELEMRQRAEKLKQEMKRLKDMRDSSTKSTSDKKSKKSK